MTNLLVKLRVVVSDMTKDEKGNYYTYGLNKLHPLAWLIFILMCAFTTIVNCFISIVDFIGICYDDIREMYEAVFNHDKP